VSQVEESQDMDTSYEDFHDAELDVSIAPDVSVSQVEESQDMDTSYEDFYGHTVFQNCAHEEIPRDTDRELKWLTPGDPAHQVLVEYLSSKNFLSQLRQAAHGTHTGTLENLHSVMLVYASKRIDFDPASYNGRMCLAIMDHNENVGRPEKKDPETGEPLYTLVYSKAVKGYRLKKRYEPKTYRFRKELLADILEHAKTNKLDKTTKRYTGKRLAKLVEKPTMEEAKAAHLPRR